jgi:hypothetical protein
VSFLVEVTHPSWVRPRWEAPPFEGMRPERLSTRLERLEEGGPEGLRKTVFRRALFPTRAGELEIRPSTVRYELPDGSEELAPAPGARLRVHALPESGRPAEFPGIVGSLSASAELLRESIPRGESARLILEVHGPANVWALETPPLPSLGAAIEVFPARPRLHVGEHRDRVSARRTFAWDLVPLREGLYEIPSFSIPYFDPSRGAYLLARSEPLRLEVTARRAGLEATGERRLPPRARPSGRAVALGASLLVLAFAAATLFLTGWARRGAKLLRAPARPRPDAALEAARGAWGTAELPRLLAEAVRAGIGARHRLDVRGLTTAEIAERIDDPEGLDLLAALDRIRFDRGGRSAESLLSAVARYVEREPLRS